MKDQAKLYDVLQRALKDAPFDGWSAALLKRACEKAGLDDKTMQRLFPAGLLDLALVFSSWADDAMQEQLKKEKLSDLRVRDRVTLAVRTRLEILAPHREALRLCTSYMSHPLRQIKTARMVWRTCDVIWDLAGDTATDYNRYTKRGLLAGVLGTTTLFWLQDDSKNHQDTWDFLDRRIENVMQAGKTLSRLKPFGKKPHAA